MDKKKPPLPARNPVGLFGGFGGFDPTRPRLVNPDGSISTERTLTIDALNPQGGVDWFNIPTIVDGQALAEQAAIDAFFAGKNRPVGKFSSVDDATEAAKNRSDALSEILNMLIRGR